MATGFGVERDFQLWPGGWKSPLTLTLMGPDEFWNPGEFLKALYEIVNSVDPKTKSPSTRCPDFVKTTGDEANVGRSSPSRPFRCGDLPIAIFRAENGGGGQGIQTDSQLQ